MVISKLNSGYVYYLIKTDIFIEQQYRKDIRKHVQKVKRLTCKSVRIKKYI